MDSEVRQIEVVRGENPRPTGGWGWSLNQYEVDYVKQFRVRPVRDQTWAATLNDEARLDQESDGILAASSADFPTPAGARKSVTHPAVWISIVLLLTVGGCVAFTAGIFNVLGANQFSVATEGLLQ